MPPRAAQGTPRAPGPRGLGIGAVINGYARGLWTYLTRVSQGRGLMLTRRQVTYDQTVAAALRALNDGLGELGQAVRRNAVSEQTSRKQDRWWVFNATLALVQKGVPFPPFLFAWVLRHVVVRSANSQLSIRAQLALAQRADDRHDLAEIMRHIRALHQVIEREAASGWRAGYPGRTTVIQKTLDYLVTRDPAVRDLAGLIAKGVIDFASIDDPLARFLLAKLVSHLIGRLGVDKAAGGLLSDLLGPLIGNPRPHDLNGVIQAIGQDIAAGQAQWQQFYESGGAQVEQAGSEWRDITSIGAEAALLVFFGLAVTEPTAWAVDVSGTIGTLAADTITGVAALIKEA